MSHNIRTYKGVRPQLGERVMIDSTSVVIGNVVLADDVGVWPWWLSVEMLTTSPSVNGLTSRTAACCI